MFSIEATHRKKSVEDGRSSSQQRRRSPGNELKRARYLIDGRLSNSSGSGDGDEEASLRQLLLE
jgi:hypothetical protein